MFELDLLHKLLLVKKEVIVSLLELGCLDIWSVALVQRIVVEEGSLGRQRLKDWLAGCRAH